MSTVDNSTGTTGPAHAMKASAARKPWAMPRVIVSELSRNTSAKTSPAFTLDRHFDGTTSGDKAS